ncbi:hypothetical protein P170DRAFT_439518 [Aspergillus steynii IBT 23096]|uniref:Dynamin family protein n=1 Tax=Aspergillus steynii IBT 23096 TaxID=1392250 RepID=A0A2I2FYS7_9EURO|nr:uncharacterized protein P170DRAFT_439518 [Aspergillus steynii IBT 23096]PLB45800.1 hypothetical protein P170DRAFT_439518 [Aspergillus steynii IBT 23096]
MASSAQDAALNQLQSEQSKLLDRVDELRTIGVGGLVELPQLIVCGNQSSGKSSVLEAISRVRFPAKISVCTRFATEVILRRHQTETIKVSIEPGPSRTDEEERKNLKSFSSDAFESDNDLGKLIEKAQEHMGMNDEADPGFKDDVLKVEILGPDKPELTLVDLPGLYYSKSKDQGAQGRKVVRALTERYMKNPRSIILAVISAKTDYHLQEVLDIAEKYDPQRERTLGVITKPDTLETGSDEQEIWLQFVRNEKIRLQLGWHVLRNRKSEESSISHEQRDENEKAFFSTGRWNSVPRNFVGIGSLRSRLSNILLKHIRRNLPALISDIQEKVTERQLKLQKLGAPRATIQEQKGFLLNISSDFERITREALNGGYDHDFFGGFDPESNEQDLRRLRAIIREFNEYFAEAMEVAGCRRQIVEHHHNDYSNQRSSNPYLETWWPTFIDRKTLEAEVSEQARKNRGIELPGSPNQRLVGILFRDQSKPWEEIARNHLMTAWDSVRFFVSLVLQHLADEHTYALIVGTLIEPELEKIRVGLLDKLDELTSYIKRGHPLPVGKSFLVRIQQARRDREYQRLRSALGKPVDSRTELGLHELEQAFSKLRVRVDEHASAEIIDEMEAYYETAIVTFVDNVATLAIENCLLRPLDRLFTSQTINNMEDDEVKHLAAEPSYILEERDRLSGELAKLLAGLRAFGPFNIPRPTMPPLAFKSKAPSKSAESNSSGRESVTPPKPSFSSNSPSTTSSTSDPLSDSETPTAPSSRGFKQSKNKSESPFSTNFSKKTSSSPPFKFRGSSDLFSRMDHPSTEGYNS